MATRVDPIEALRGASRSTARAGSLPRKTLVVLQAALSLVLLSASGLLTAALQRLENQDFGFDQDRRIVANINPRLAGYRAEQLPPLYRRIHDSLSSVPAYRPWLSACTHRKAAEVGALASGWMAIPLRGPRMTTLLRGIESPRDTLTSSGPRSSEGAASPSRIRRLRGTWQSSMRRLRGSFSKTKIPLAGTSARMARIRAVNTKSWAWPKMPAI